MTDNKFQMPFQMFAKELNQRCSKLSIVDVMVYSILWDDYLFYMDKYGFYAPSQSDLAEEAGVTRKCVNAVLQRLEKCGLLIVTGKAGLTNKYEVIHYQTLDLFDLPAVGERKAARRAENAAKRQRYYDSEEVGEVFSKAPEQEEPPEAPAFIEPPAIPVPVITPEPVEETPVLTHIGVPNAEVGKCKFFGMVGYNPERKEEAQRVGDELASMGECIIDNWYFFIQ